MLRVFGESILAKAIKHGFLEIENLLHAPPRLHALEMSRAVWKTAVAGVELDATAQAPEKMRIGGREMVEKEFAARKHIVGNPVGFEEHLFGGPAHAFIGTRYIATRFVLLIRDRNGWMPEAHQARIEIA
jgi:hypothetical protein